VKRFGGGREGQKKGKKNFFKLISERKIFPMDEKDEVE